MAGKWNITRRRVATLCKEGRIEGAVLKGKTWLIPDDAPKPEDPRRCRRGNIEQDVDSDGCVN